MARPYRLQGEGCFYHITSRGDDRKAIFKNDRDYEKFLEYISSAKTKYKFYVYAYCLMTNHYHLLLETSEANISRIMHYLNGSYTIYYNTKRGRCGHLFQGRYKSIVIDKDNYFLELSRYIHLNPVKAKIVESPEQYRWSSFNGFLGKKDAVIDSALLKQSINMTVDQYSKFVMDGIHKDIDPFKNVYAGFLLGTEGFIKEQLGVLRNQVGGGDVSFKKNIQSYEIETIVAAVGHKYNVTGDILYSSRNKPVLARKIAIYLATRLTSLQNGEIGGKFGITYSAVSKAAKDIERRIEDNRGLKRDIDGIISRFKG